MEQFYPPSSEVPSGLAELLGVCDGALALLGPGPVPAPLLLQVLHDQLLETIAALQETTTQLEASKAQVA